MAGIPGSDDVPVDFIDDVLISGFASLKKKMGEKYPRVFLILGNEDLKAEEPRVESWGEMGLGEYIHNRVASLDEFRVFGYSYVPPTPFRLKDWERYDVSRYVDPGCTHPSEGIHSVEIDERELKYSTIEQDLRILTGSYDVSKGILLIHTPPYQTSLDRAGLDGKMVDHVPLNVHVGSIAVRRFIEEHQPYLTLHGHVHESCSIMGTWRDKIGKTPMFTAAHDGPELAVVRFDLEDPDSASRELT